MRKIFFFRKEKTDVKKIYVGMYFVRPIFIYNFFVAIFVKFRLNLFFLFFVFFNLNWNPNSIKQTKTKKQTLSLSLSWSSNNMSIAQFLLPNSHLSINIIIITEQKFNNVKIKKRRIIILNLLSWKWLILIRILLRWWQQQQETKWATRELRVFCTLPYHEIYERRLLWSQ